MKMIRLMRHQDGQRDWGAALRRAFVHKEAPTTHENHKPSILPFRHVLFDSQVQRSSPQSTQEKPEESTVSESSRDFEVDMGGILSLSTPPDPEKCLRDAADSQSFESRESPSEWLVSWTGTRPFKDETDSNVEGYLGWRGRSFASIQLVDTSQMDYHFAVIIRRPCNAHVEHDDSTCTLDGQP